MLLHRVRQILKVTEFLHRTSSKILLKYLNVCYGVVFNALCTATSVKTIARADLVSIKDIGLFGQALLSVFTSVVAVLSSRVSFKTMEDNFSGRQAEDELRLKVINKFQGMGDLTLVSPKKKRPADGKPEELMKNKQLKEKGRSDGKMSGS